jgi:phenylalanyl-tRNA synthetase beta chain
MQFPESWLRSFCDPQALDSEALAEKLTMSGFEVEQSVPAAPPFAGVVVGEIVAAEPHPSADRLRVCLVDAGAASREGPLQIVCGAPNARVGLKAPLALVGAVLPPGPAGEPLRIGEGRLRGVASHGMLCSAKELGIDEDASGLLELPAALPPGQDLRAALALDERLFTLKLTPNLGHALSVFGLARELAAVTGAPLAAPAIAPVPPAHDRRLPVKVLAPDLCGRFSGRVITGVNPRAKTPAWMVERLARCGQRSVSALVDISNYVMFELGRPSHIFDLDTIEGGLEVRWARAGERLALLNGQTIELDGRTGLIADANAPESLAGIMGGAATAVSDTTTNIYVEAAFWWPEAIQGRSRRFGFATDAGHRFERGVDPSGTALHIERITRLVLDICGGSPGPVDDQVLGLPERRPVTLRVARASRVLGLPVTQAECADVLRRIGMEVNEGGGGGEGTLVALPPPWRFDLAIEEDLIEEVIRVLGVHRLPERAPVGALQSLPAPQSRRGVHTLRHLLAARGYVETVNWSFVEPRLERDFAANEAPVRVLNPIAAPMSVMRSTLIGSLVEVLRTNLARRAPRVRVFEVGRVFLRDPAAEAGEREVAGLRQPRRVAGLAWGPALPMQWGATDRSVDFHDIKGDLEALLAPRALRFVRAAHPALHPGRSARIEAVDAVDAAGAPMTIGHVGELHPRWRQAYDLPSAPVVFELALDAALERALPMAGALPRQQAALRDLALVVGADVTHEAIVAALAADPVGRVRDVCLFDVWRPGPGQAGFAPGERSFALRLSLRDDERTLAEAEIDEAVAAAVRRAEAACGARLRQAGTAGAA